MAADRRLPLIDIARAVALIAMIVFHFGRDMDVLGLWPQGSTFTPIWQWSARLIAGSFVFLAGVSLWLAHGERFQAQGYLRRLGLLVVAAAAVSLATWLTFPGAWVRFGILHSIAASSVIGLAFLRLPGLVTIGMGLLVIWLGVTVSVPSVSGAGWLWLGLAPPPFAMMDWEPIFPWTGPFLLGLGLARIADRMGWIDAIRGRPAGAIWRRLGWPGRHSLAVYLVHQPVLIGGILACAWVAARI